MDHEGMQYLRKGIDGADKVRWADDEGVYNSLQHDGV